MEPSHGTYRLMKKGTGMMMIAGLVLLGLVVGILGGMLGVGGGVFLVPVMTLLMGVETHKAIGLSTAFIIPTMMSSFVKHYSAGNVDLKFAAMIIVGGIVGGYLGATLAQHVPGAVLKKIFGVFLLITAGRMILS